MSKLSPSRKPGKAAIARGSKRSMLDFSSVGIKCSFCHNTFYARPAEAVCPKCDRPANRPLPILWRAVSLLLPPLGLGYAFLIRAHSPVAAWQGFKWSLGGAAIFAVIAVARTL